MRPDEVLNVVIFYEYFRAATIPSIFKLYYLYYVCSICTFCIWHSFLDLGWNGLCHCSWNRYLPGIYVHNLSLIFRKFTGALFNIYLSEICWAHFRVKETCNKNKISCLTRRQMLQILRTKNRDLIVTCKRSADVSHHELYNSCTLIIFLFKGDSGGPMSVKNSSSQHTLVGVVSWGAGCALVIKIL
jgi:hypothetical protein